MNFDQLTTENGLSNDYVQCILQDRKDFIWIGTNDGLNMYDGYEFKVYTNRTNDKTSISGNVIFKIIEDKKSRLWIATDNGVDLFERERVGFKHIPFLDTNQVRYEGYNKEIFENDKNNIYVTSSSNIYIYDEKKSGFVPFLDSINEYSLFQKDGIETFIIDRKNRIWIGSQAFGLFAYDLENNKLIASPVTKTPFQIKDKIFSITENPDGTIWIGTDKGLLYIKEDLSKIEKIQNGNDHFTYIFKIYFDSHNRIWLGTNGNGLINYDAAGNTYSQYMLVKSNPKSINSNSIRTIFEDKQGILWFGTYSGGISYSLPENSRKFTLVKNEPFNRFSPYNQVSAIFEDSQGNLWIGTDGGGLDYIDQKTSVKTHYETDLANPNSISGNSILTINEDKSGNIWVGGYLMGINIFDRKTGKVKRLRNIPKNSNSLSHNDVRDICFDENSIVYIATNGGGLNIYNPKTDEITRYNEENSDIASNWCLRVFEDYAGKIWIGTYNGISIFDRTLGSFRNIVKENDSDLITHNWIYAFAEDVTKKLWIGTAKGLNYYDPLKNEFVKQFKSEILNNIVINGISVDKNDDLWISSNKGIFKYNFTKNKIKNFDYHDGLQGNQFIHGSYYQTKTGKIYFGGLNGYNYFYPDSIKDNKHMPSVYINDLLIFYEKAEINKEGSPLTKSISEQKKIILNHKQSVFTLKYSAIDFINPEKNQYKYKLEGFDKYWNFVGSRREATYTNIDPGTYIFTVKASNNDGIWNDTGTSLTIVVLPPWWKTLIFKIVLLIIILAILLNYYFYRINSLNKKRIQLEKLVKQRTTEIESKNAILEQQTYFLNETNTLLEERQQLIEEQTEELKAQAEELSEKNKSLKTVNVTKDKFFSIIAHDLKSPFNSILGFTEYLTKNYDVLDDSDKKEYLSFVYNSAQRIYNLLERLLEWARTQTGNISFKPEVVDLKEIIYSNIEINRNSLNEKDIKLTKKIPETINVFADKNMISTVFRNLLTNAIKFTEKGEIRITVEIQDNKCYCSITDTGVGIPEDKLDTLFAIDHAKSTEGTRGEPGTGLGLLICKEFVEKNNGKLTVTSKAGEGTTFTYTLPLK